MTTTRTKPGKRLQNGPVSEAITQLSNEPNDVLTLAEAAAYLRITEEDVLRMVHTQGLVGRHIGDQWRFLKSALQCWLRTSPSQTNNEALTSVIGSWKDDPELDQMLQEIYRRRGRPMTEEGP
jgi:excisionase family DNA binding protein